MVVIYVSKAQIKNLCKCARAARSAQRILCWVCIHVVLLYVVYVVCESGVAAHRAVSDCVSAIYRLLICRYFLQAFSINAQARDRSPVHVCVCITCVVCYTFSIAPGIHRSTSVYTHTRM